jgi:hypothetical protein
MKNLTVLLVVLLIISPGCTEKKNTGNNPPAMPESENYDFNNDEVDDFIIEYEKYTWDSRGNRGDGQAGKIVPLNGNLILTGQDELALFHEIYDTIQKEVGLPLKWISLEKDLVMVENSSANDFVWPDEWSVLSDNNGPDYYLGVIISDEIPVLGWIKLKITASTGVIEVMDKEFVEGDFIMINR